MKSPRFQSITLENVRLILNIFSSCNIMSKRFSNSLNHRIFFLCDNDVSNTPFSFSFCTEKNGARQNRIRWTFNAKNFAYPKKWQENTKISVFHPIKLSISTTVFHRAGSRYDRTFQALTWPQQTLSSLLEPRFFYELARKRRKR